MNKNCPKTFQPGYYKRYVKNNFLLFEKVEQVLIIVTYLSKKDKNINLLFQTEKDNSFSQC